MLKEGRADLPPPFWTGYAELDRATSLRQLVAVLGNAHAPLHRQVEADAALRKLTGASAGWSWSGRERARDHPAEKWRALIASLPGQLREPPGTDWTLLP